MIENLNKILKESIDFIIDMWYIITHKDSF